MRFKISKVECVWAFLSKQNMIGSTHEDISLEDSDSISKSNKIAWIDHLLETPIPYHRYFCLWHILLPHLVTIKGLAEHEVVSILTEWLDRCNQLNRVSWRYPQRIKGQLRYDKGYPPISLENLKKENYELYKLLQN